MQNIYRVLITLCLCSCVPGQPAVAFSSVGWSDIDRSVLQIPMMLDSYAELDYVFGHLTPERRCAANSKSPC